MAEADRGFLGLTHNPFVQPDEGFFEQADRKTHLEQLRHLSQWSRRVLVVTGPPGMGKSVLYRQLSTNLEPRCKAARIHGSLVNTSREVLLAVAQGFGIAASADANGQLLTSLIESHVDEQSAAERICVVMVDDADKLEPKAVVDLLTLAQGCSLQLVLFGQERLVPAIERVTGRLSLGWHELRLAGFSEQQTRAYLEWRFQQARYRGRLPFTENQVKEIQRLSDGLPGKINQLANVLLVKLESGDIGKSTSMFPPIHRALLALLLVVIGLLYMLWQQEEELDQALVLAQPETLLPPATEQVGSEATAEESSAAGEEVSGGIPAPQPRSVDDPRVSAARRLEQTETETAALSQPEDSTGASASLIENVAKQEPLPQLRETAAASQTSQSPDQPTIDRELAGLPAAATDITTADVEPEPGATAQTPIVRPVEPQPAEDTDPQPETETLAESASPAQPEEIVDAPAAEPAVPAEALSEDVEENRNADWLLAQAGNKFTLQLVTVSSAERAQAFIDRQSDRRQFASYELARGGRILHVVVYGLYDTRAEAEAAASRLSAEAGDVTPWIRTMEQVHGAIYTVR
jgi:septal ring-binding cell division protein DamX/type II secretory pathway predicted ATPase ExeA